MAHLYSIYCKVKERIHGETSHAISIKKCKCMRWMDGWMDGCGLLLKVMVFALESSLSLSLFLRHGYPFLSLFFWSCFFGMPSFLSFWGNHNLTLFYFWDVLRERSPRHGAFIDGEWMDGGANSWYRNVAYGWTCTCLWSRKHEKYLTRVTQFDKTQ